MERRREKGEGSEPKTGPVWLVGEEGLASRTGPPTCSDRGGSPARSPAVRRPAVGAPTSRTGRSHGPPPSLIPDKGGARAGHHQPRRAHRSSPTGLFLPFSGDRPPDRESAGGLWRPCAWDAADIASRGGGVGTNAGEASGGVVKGGHPPFLGLRRCAERLANGVRGTDPVGGGKGWFGGVFRASWGVASDCRGVQGLSMRQASAAA